MASETIWSFGYGSNMNVKALEARKKVQVLEHTPALLKGFKMEFNLSGIRHVEPAFSGLAESPGSQVHGVAFKMSLESAENLTQCELSGVKPLYDKKMVILHSYTGRELEGFIFMNKSPPSLNLVPSSRYLGLLVKGAQQAGLDPNYIEKLSKQPTYKPNDAVLKARKERSEKVEELDEITVEQLSKNENWVSCLGYVFEHEKVSFRSLGPNTRILIVRGRDITIRTLLHFHGIDLDDDKGCPPYPLLKDLQGTELDYITCWLDHYALDTNDSPRPIIGYLKEFKEQQNSNSTTFVLPPIP